MKFEDMDTDTKQRRFDELMESLAAGEVVEEDMTPDDLALLRELYGAAEGDLEDLFENLRRLRETEK